SASAKESFGFGAEALLPEALLLAFTLLRRRWRTRLITREPMQRDFLRVLAGELGVLVVVPSSVGASCSAGIPNLDGIAAAQEGFVLVHHPLHLLQGFGLDLAHARGAHAELGRQVLKRERFFGKTARLEDAPLALVEHGECFIEKHALVV